MADKYIDADAAEQSILQTAEALLGETDTSQTAVYTLYAKKLVADVLDYCHRDDFPKGLVYTCADLLVRRVSDTADDTKGLKSIKMDDTQFDFAHGDVTAGTQADADFETIRPKLNLYRKIGGWS